jgi:hypothetical protein
MQLAADGIGGHADADQIVGAVQVDGFSARHHGDLSGYLARFLVSQLSMWGLAFSQPPGFGPA